MFIDKITKLLSDDMPYINPYLTNGFAHHYQLGESTFILVLAVIF